MIDPIENNSQAQDHTTHQGDESRRSSFRTLLSSEFQICFPEYSDSFLSPCTDPVPLGHITSTVLSRCSSTLWLYKLGVLFIGRSQKNVIIEAYIFPKMQLEGLNRLKHTFLQTDTEAEAQRVQEVCSRSQSKPVPEAAQSSLSPGTQSSCMRKSRERESSRAKWPLAYFVAL